MGTIKHEWNGTVLTITSDSGTSSCNLKGAKGDDGCRGAQGSPGIIVDTTGNILLEGYVTREYLDSLLDNKTIALDFSGWGAGYFIETLRDGTEIQHDLEYDDSGNIISIAGIAVAGV
jgi:hypothetical protein